MGISHSYSVVIQLPFFKKLKTEFEEPVVSVSTWCRRLKMSQHAGWSSCHRHCSCDVAPPCGPLDATARWPSQPKGCSSLVYLLVNLQEGLVEILATGEWIIMSWYADGERIPAVCMCLWSMSNVKQVFSLTVMD